MRRKQMDFGIVRRAGVAACALVLLGPPLARADGLAPGLWQITTTAEIDGQTGPPARSMKCLKPEDAADLERTFSPASRTTNSTCEDVDRESTPTRLKWHLVCTGQLDMDMAGEFTFDT